ncbi:hypothetical protein SUGI_0949900 [Cryptomeria japonica]|nr:hypothetical protein SUGI_0949900 [Cryptomeria japonica]
MEKSLAVFEELDFLTQLGNRFQGIIRVICDVVVSGFKIDNAVIKIDSFQGLYSFFEVMKPGLSLRVMSMASSARMHTHRRLTLWFLFLTMLRFFFFSRRYFLERIQHNATLSTLIPTVGSQLADENSTQCILHRSGSSRLLAQNYSAFFGAWSVQEEHSFILEDKDFQLGSLWQHYPFGRDSDEFGQLHTQRSASSRTAFELSRSVRAKLDGSDC